MCTDSSLETLNLLSSTHTSQSTTRSSESQNLLLSWSEPDKILQKLNGLSLHCSARLYVGQVYCDSAARSRAKYGNSSILTMGVFLERNLTDSVLQRIFTASSPTPENMLKNSVVYRSDIQYSDSRKKTNTMQTLSASITSNPDRWVVAYVLTNRPERWLG